MTPQEFIAKWTNATLGERQGAQQHFIDLCELLNQPKPAAADKHGDYYCFERGATKAGGGDGWADVWRRGCFGWEYKGPHKDLNSAYRQLSIYAAALENPPYLVVSDMSRIIVYTNWTNTVSREIQIKLEDLHEPTKLAVLRKVFEGSDDLKPRESPQELTEKVAAKFGELGRRLQVRGHPPREVAHFLNRLVFCMFAEDAKLLPDKLFTRLIKGVQNNPVAAFSQLTDLFMKMSVGGFFGPDTIKWFNGGLFDGALVLPLERADLKLIGDTAAEHNWSQIDPAIFGTFFEVALKTGGRQAALGAHYTDREKILRLVEPLIIQPLALEWNEAYLLIVTQGDKMDSLDVERQSITLKAGELFKTDPAAAKAGEMARRKRIAAIARARTIAYDQAKAILDTFLEKLAGFRILDPACGSGNFLYVALHALKDLELKAIIDTERKAGIPQQAPRVGLDSLWGIEVEEYAAELARVTLWIGQLQWVQKNGYVAFSEPILRKLHQIQRRDALVNVDGTVAKWPDADIIIGNPPFLGGKWMLSTAGEEVAATLRRAYLGKVPAGADLVAYWFERARSQIMAGKSKAAGFVSTNMIRGPANRPVMQNLVDDTPIFEAWSDEPWAVAGADVRVSMVAFSSRQPVHPKLDGSLVNRIQADLKSSTYEGRDVIILADNKDLTARGVEPGGAFDISGPTARSWLMSPRNVNGLFDNAVLKRLVSGHDMNGRDRDLWIIDFNKLSEAQAAEFERPYEHLKAKLDYSKRNWWRFRRSGADVRALLAGKPQVIGTVLVSKYRTFRWLQSGVLPDTRIVVIGRDDDTSFGVLSSRFHELWTLRFCQKHGVGNDPVYTPSNTFHTFPFPSGLTPNILATDYADDTHAKNIAEAARNLNDKREAWLNPTDLVRVEPEVVAGYVDRILAVTPDALETLRDRTITNLYNQRPSWLELAHQRLDCAVAEAYGWSTKLTDDEVLEHLFALNQNRVPAT